MTSSGVTGVRRGPLYFFDQVRMQFADCVVFKEKQQNIYRLLTTLQPARRKPVKGVRGSILHFGTNEEPQFEGRTLRYRNLKEKEGRKEEGSTSLNFKDPMEAYKRAAPQLLNELARLLSRRKWSEERRIPHGTVNILNQSWHELTAGALRLSPKLSDKPPKSAGSLKLQQTPRQVSAGAQEETAETNSCAAGSAGFTERKPQAQLNPRVNKSEQKSSRGWITQLNQASNDVPECISSCQLVVEWLRGANNIEKLPKPELDVNRLPWIPEVKQRDPAQHKLHYRSNDGSSFIYYPSGCMAVCQSHSGLSCGGFYTNVFSDNKFPVILATITAFGRGAVTHPLSSAITALWDQDGGFIGDIYGNKTKEWSWKTDPRKKITIQISDFMSVSLLSGTSAMLTFRCENQSVQLPLSSLSNLNQLKEIACLKTQEKFISDAAQDLLQPRERKHPVLTNKSACSWEALQMVREGKRQEESPAQWKRGGHPSGTLMKLQRRAQKTVEDWLDYYRVAIGIKCPDSKRMPDAPLRTGPKREAQSAALPSLNPPEQADAKPVQPEESRDEFHRHLSPPAERVLDSPVVLPRTPKKHAKKERGFMLIGPLRIYGTINPESVILPNDPKLQTSTAIHHPAVAPLPPSVPLTVCPDLLRAVLLGEEQRRSCCCSTKLMPVVTDLEYDAFIMGQPPHTQQILVVCVTLPCEPVNKYAMPSQDSLEKLYRRKNKHRTMPCTQCQTDSFRLVRYETEAEDTSYESKSILLWQRHRVAPGMVLMYIRGSLLFVGYICSDRSFSARDLEKQISRSRRDYRLGLSLPSDYKFSDSANAPGATDATLT